MDQDNYSVNINCVVSGIFKRRLKKSGHIWQTSPVEICQNNKVIDTACKLCDEFESRYENVFRKLGHEFDNIDLTVDSFHSVLDELCEGELNWGRVTGILTFASVMAVITMDKNKDYHDRVELIRDWTCSYMQSKVDKWMKQNNGWKGLVDFYEEGKSQDEQKNGTDRGGWGVVLGCLGAVAIGALIVNRA